MELILKGQEPWSSPDIGWHLEHRHGRDGRVEVEVQGKPTVARTRLSSDDGDVTARDEFVWRHDIEQALRRLTQRNGLNMPEACLSIAIARGHDKAINAAQLLGQRSSSGELPKTDLKRQLLAITFCC